MRFIHESEWRPLVDGKSCGIHNRQEAKGVKRNTERIV